MGDLTQNALRNDEGLLRGRGARSLHGLRMLLKETSDRPKQKDANFVIFCKTSSWFPRILLQKESSSAAMCSYQYIET